MYVLIVEDDPAQYELIKRQLQTTDLFSDAKISRIVTELQFYDQFEETATNKPDLIIMDVMLRWTDAAPDMRLPPSDIAVQGFFRAGVRCEQMLASDERTKEIPIMIYSVLEKKDIEAEIPGRSQVTYLEKNFDPFEIEHRFKEKAF
jgi:CheY-like chemotaxis protein